MVNHFLFFERLSMPEIVAARSHPPQDRPIRRECPIQLFDIWKFELVEQVVEVSCNFDRLALSRLGSAQSLDGLVDSASYFIAANLPASFDSLRLSAGRLLR